MAKYEQDYECGACGETFYTQLAKDLHWDAEHSELEF